MKRCLIILSFSVLFFTCSTKQKSDTIDYIKIITFCSPDTVTLYNKGLGLENFVYYEPAKDSLIYKELIDIDTIKHKTYIAKLEGTNYIDSFINLVNALKKYGNGTIADTTQHGNDYAYCGPIFYVEYKTNKEIHYKYFMIDKDQAFNRFSHFFFHLREYPLKRKFVDNKLVNGDKEMVAAMVRLGKYERMEVPYIPNTCEDGVDHKKIFGSWRAVGKEFNYKDIYLKLTFTPNETCFLRHVNRGVEKSKKGEGKFFIDKKDNILTITAMETGEVFKYWLLKVTDSCLVMKDLRGNSEMKYDRL